MNNGKKLLVVTGISGGGKTTVTSVLQQKYSNQFHSPLRVTDRAPRLNEVQGVDYHFTSSTDELFAMHDLGLLLYTPVTWYGAQYSILHEGIDDALSQGIPVFFETVVPGAVRLIDEYPDLEVKVVFLVTPDDEEQARRLRLRGESEEKITQRVAVAHLEREMLLPLIRAGKVREFVNEIGRHEETISQVEEYLFK